MTALLQYDRARAALAECRTADQVRVLQDEMEHVKLYGRQIKDRTLIADATEIQTRAEKRLGELLLEAERLGWIGRGRPKENVPTPEHFTLEEAGIDRKLSARAQKLATMPEVDFERGLYDVRERIISGDATIINGARAVMSSRQEPDDSLDFFPTPPWATRALMEEVIRPCWWHYSVFEPACGEGHIAEVLAEYFSVVKASDVHDYGYAGVINFLEAEFDRRDFDWIITNPPFGDKTEQFVLRALDLAIVGVAMFVRLQWLESIGRYETIFRDHPPTQIAFFAERVNLCKGRWEPDGTTATAYIWLVWRKGRQLYPPIWIPPGQRERLTFKDDVKRFTAHPVTKKNPESAADPETSRAMAAPEPAPFPFPSGAGSPSDSGGPT
jgi:hypothetical protein